MKTAAIISAIEGRLARDVGKSSASNPYLGGGTSRQSHALRKKYLAWKAGWEKRDRELSRSRPKK